MNVSSDYIREKLRVFDGFWNKVSKKALLRDTGYWIPPKGDIFLKVPVARNWMAEKMNKNIRELHLRHTGINGRFDCENYAILGCNLVQLIHDNECIASGSNAYQYAIFPMARADINHTQALCISQNDMYVVEFINGEIRPASKVNPKILLVG